MSCCKLKVASGSRGFPVNYFQFKVYAQKSPLRQHLADKKYGFNSSEQDEGGQDNYTNGYPVGTLSSHLNLLEDFSPFRTGDHFHWIPQGLFYDMMDNLNDINANPQRVLLDDQVTGHTNAQMFNAFQSTIYTLHDYSVKLLQQTNNPTAASRTCR